MTLSSKIRNAQDLSASLVCVGLDPDPDRLPAPLQGLPLQQAIRHFCLSIIEATHKYACAYKPNLAFFEALGRGGWSILHDVVEAIPGDRVVVADGKRGDIGNTARRYAAALFDGLGCDACTVSPYMGRDSIVPFLSHPGTGAYALVRTSNDSAEEIQGLMVGDEPLYLRVARMLAEVGSNSAGEIGFVVGATDPDVLFRIRSLYPDIPLLIPGVGAQGGDASRVAEAARSGSGPVIVNASRSILYAGPGPDFKDRAEDAAAELRDLLNAPSSPS